MIRSKLEWLGFEVALRRYLLVSVRGVRENATAALLTELVKHAGTPQSAEHLIAHAGLKSVESLRALLSRLRDALRDMGFATRVPYLRSAGGYLVTREEADELWSRVLEDLELAA